MSRKRMGVVIAGGSGERFWPVSRPDRPKQLLNLTRPDKTMLQEAIDRIEPLFGKAGTYVATSAALADPILRSGTIAPGHLVAEPARRNTLGALCWLVANLLADGHGDATIGIVTADHIIGEPDQFRACVSAAMDVAESEGAIVTIGIPPDRPETGYGYIEVSDQGAAKAEDGRTVERAESFREKPSLETAHEFVESGRFYWNGGMFFFTIETFLRELLDARPEAHALTLKIAEARKSGDAKAAVKAFEELPSISVDYAVMERAKKVFSVRADFPWDDVGAWDSMARTFPADDQGNVRQGDAVLIDCEDCIVVNECPGTPVAAIDVRELIIVATEHGVLVCPRDAAQRVKEVVTALAKRSN